MTKHLITSALPYINGIKHIGNLIGSMLPADVYARFLRAQGEHVLYICATDEHGTPAELAALDAGMEVGDYCAIQHQRQVDLYSAYDLSFDHFGRTSSPENHELTQHFAARLEENGYIEEREMVQLYSTADGRFLPDRYVLGTCPYCGFTNARGDQCENCTRVLDPKDLINPRSAISGSTDLEERTTKHLFLRQDKLSGEIRDWLATKEGWPQLVRSIAFKWLDEGLRGRAITRDLSWGVPVNRPGFENKVFYVWFDAPIEYIGSTVEWSRAGEGREWKDWWKGDGEVVYTQFMAKDNIPFHTISFPATIMGAREDWKLVDFIKGFNWLNFYGGKFSTSAGVGIFLDQALELRGSDYWRWYLVANAPESDDATFTFERFATTINTDLANTLGNFVNRTLSFTTRHLGESVPDGGEPGDIEDELHLELVTLTGQYTESLAALEYRKAAGALREIWSLGNRYLEQREPWRSIKIDRDEAAMTLRTAINIIRHVAVLSEPIIPATSATMLTAVGENDDVSWPRVGTDADASDLALDVIPPGRPISVPEILFTKITDDEVTEWTERFASGADSAATSV